MKDKLERIIFGVCLSLILIGVAISLVRWIAIATSGVVHLSAP